MKYRNLFHGSISIIHTYLYNEHNVFTCVTNDDYNIVDVIKVQSAGVFGILNLISCIVEHSSDACFIPLYRSLGSK